MVALAGAITGLLVGMTGVGGGSLMTPLLVLVFGVAPLSAVGTDLWFAAITKLAATGIHSRHGLIDWQVARRLWLGSLSASALAIVLIGRLSDRPEMASVVKITVACAVIVTAVGLLFQRRLHSLGRKPGLRIDSTAIRLQAPLTVLAGAVLGALVSLTSIGAGALGVVFLVYLYPLRLTPPRLIATDIVHAIPLAIFAGVGHLIIGNVDFALMTNMLLGSIPAVLVGATLSSRLPHQALRVSLVVLLLLVGTKLISS
jgi:uncharacterized membrane protein YfcA